ncbi:MAG: phosphate ABC transporter ATP-binding protein [Candidatus Verstraetearchaeota archaeon]|jgi:tungstate transport system ATP-binding protein|nr:phosphate ABC transporter ATP-binding protein [Candidatus Verstraetearchaeota archaeon]
MRAVEVRGLSKDYSGRLVLRDVTFDVHEGEFFVLLGPNGSGKTTLLRILDLLEEPTTGKVFFEGEEVDYSKDRATLRRKIGMVFQQTVLFDMSVFDNVAYPLKIRGDLAKANIERKVARVLEDVELSGFERKNALALSGGEAQRVALAQALVAEPKLLLLDEPTANLDPKNVSIVEGILSRLNREKRTTIIMTTHNMFQAERLAQRVALLNEGEIKAIGSFRDVFGNQSLSSQ